MTVAVNANVAIPNAQGKRVPYVFGTRMDNGLVGLFRSNAFLGDTVKVETQEQPMDLTGWFVTPPQAGGEWFAYAELLTDPRDVKSATDMGAKPLSSYVV